MNKIRYKGAKVIGIGIGDNKALEKLHIGKSYNYLDENSLEDEGAKEIADGLRANYTLKILHLGKF